MQKDDTKAMVQIAIVYILILLIFVYIGYSRT